MDLLKWQMDLPKWQTLDLSFRLEKKNITVIFMYWLYHCWGLAYLIGISDTM